MVVATIAQPDGPVAGLHSDKAAIEACEPLLIHFTGHPFAQFALRHRPQPFGSEFAGAQAQAMGYIVAVYHEIRAACIDAADDEDRKSTRLNSSHSCAPRMPSSA